MITLVWPAAKVQDADFISCKWIMREASGDLDLPPEPKKVNWRGNAFAPSFVGRLEMPYDHFKHHRRSIRLKGFVPITQK